MSRPARGPPIHGVLTVEYVGLEATGPENAEFSVFPRRLHAALVSGSRIPTWSLQTQPVSGADPETRDVVPFGRAEASSWWVSIRLERFEALREVFRWIFDADPRSSDGATLRLARYSETWNEERYKCMHPTGVGEVDLSALLRRALSDPPGQKRGVYRFEEAEVDLIAFRSRYDPASGVRRHANPPVVREARVVVRMALMVPDGYADDEAGARAAIVHGAADPPRGVRFFDEIDARSVRDVREAGVRPRIEGVCERVRCPEFQLPPFGSLPGGFYVLYGAPVAPASEDYFGPLFRACALEMGVDAARLEEATRSDGACEREHRLLGELVVRTISSLAWSLHYLADFSNANARGEPYARDKIDARWNDAFKNTFYTLSGDCEDLEFAVYRLFKDLVSPSTPAYRDRALEATRRFFGRAYLPILATCVASQASEGRRQRERLALRKGANGEESVVGDRPMATGLASEETSGALPPVGDASVGPKTAVSHTACLLVPKRRFVEMARREIDAYGDMGSARENGPGAGRIDAALDALLDEAGPDATGTPLEVFFCEGTYPTLPLHPSAANPRSVAAASRAEAFLSNHGELGSCFEYVKAIEPDVRDRFCKMFVRGFTDALWNKGVRSLDVCFTRRGLPDGEGDRYGLWSDELLDPRRRDVASPGLFFYNFLSEAEAGFFRGVVDRDPPVSRVALPSAEALKREVGFLSGLMPSGKEKSLAPGQAFHGRPPATGAPPSFSLRLKGTLPARRLSEALVFLSRACASDGRHDVVATPVPCHDGHPVLGRPVVLLRFDFYARDPSR